MKKIILLLALIGLGYFFLTLSHEEEGEHIEMNNQEAHNHKQINSPAAATISPGGKIEKKGTNAHNHNPIKGDDFDVSVVDIPNSPAGESLTSLSEIMVEFGKKDIDIEELKNSLIDKGLKLTVAKDKNQYTGAMTVIRTENSLPGTRYFHSQIFYSDTGKPFIQHMSFEYQASENAFAEAVAATKKQFKLKKDANVKKKGFYSWSTDDGYVIWIKKMSAQDLKDDPFNAYSKEDVGTIKVAKELEIH